MGCDATISRVVEPQSVQPLFPYQRVAVGSYESGGGRSLIVDISPISLQRPSTIVNTGAVSMSVPKLKYQNVYGVP